MNLTTTYLGLTLKHPVVASASPLSKTLDGIKRLEDGGAAAVVMYSLFEEEITALSNQLEYYLSYHAEMAAEALSLMPADSTTGHGPDDYLDLLTRAKASTSIPMIGSLNGISNGGWTEYARKIEQAGADAIELNMFYLAADPYLTAAGVEQGYLDVVREVRSSVKIPVAVKLVPYFSSLANMAERLVRAGADGLVLFNRFYQPDFDLENNKVVQHLVLSNAHEIRLPLHWTAILAGRVDCDLAITTGVHSYLEALKGVMAGAHVVMMASELMRHGARRIGEVVAGMNDWMTNHDYESIDQIRGMLSYRNVDEPSAYERANYMQMLHSWHGDRHAGVV